MKVIFLLLIFHFIILISSFELTEEQKKKYQESEGIKRELIATGIVLASIFEYLLNNIDYKGSGCYKGASIIPECPKGTEEHISFFPYIRRKCYKSCKANEIRKGNLCHKCRDGVEIQLKEYAFDDIFYMKIVCGPNEEKPDVYSIEVEPNHCIKNTFPNKDGCDSDCSILGLKNFGDFLNGYCAKDEEEYKQLLNLKIKMDINIFLFDIKYLVSKLLRTIFDPSSVGFENLISNFFILSNQKIETANFEKFLFDLKVNLILKKQLLKQLGKEIFIDKIKEYIVSSFDKETTEKIINKSKNIIDLMWKRIINTNKIETMKPDKKNFDGIFKSALNQLIRFVDILHIKDYIDFALNCRTSKEFIYDECIESIITVLDDLDPFVIVSLIKTLVSLIIPICDIPVKPENNDIIYYWGGEPYPLFYNDD